MHPKNLVHLEGNNVIRPWTKRILRFGVYFGILCRSSLSVAAEACEPQWAAPQSSKPRIIITTDGDIENQSVFLHYLMYANEFETRGIIAGRSKWHPDGNGGREWIEDIINIYGGVRPNLLQHMPGWPEANQLLGVVKSGNMADMGLDGVGEGKDTPGSNLIAGELLSEDPGPIWVLAWGGLDDLAQALYHVRSHNGDQVTRVIAKLRIFALSLQDVDNADNPSNPKESGWWILRNFPDVFMILSYQFMAINGQHGPHPYTDHPLFSQQWLDTNVLNGHGPLGARYPQGRFAEGNAISFLYFVNPRLGTVNNPFMGSWGGRYNNGISGRPALFYTDSSDETDSWMPVWRWIPAIANDFAARMDYSVRDYKGANHRPQAALAGPYLRSVKPGEVVTLDAGCSADPDGDKLTYRFWQYKDAGTVQQTVELNGADTSKASFTIPPEPSKILHVVLEVTDQGTPPLKDYISVVFSIE